MNALFRFLSGLGHTSRLVWEHTVGRFIWQPPAWVERMRVGCTGCSGRVMGIVGGLVFAAIALGGVWSWWSHRPRPEQVQVIALMPELSSVEENHVVPQPLFVRFSRSAAALDLIGKKVVRGAELRPALPGTWTWTSDQELRFDPETDWPAGETYTVALQSSILGKAVKLANDRPTFMTQPFSATLSALEFYVNPKDPTLKQAVGRLTFSHPVDAATLAGQIDWKWQRSDYFERSGESRAPFEVIMGDANRSATIRSLPIRLPGEDAYLSLILDKGLRPMGGDSRFGQRLEQTLRVPSLYTLFHFEDATASVAQRSDGELDQVLLLQSSIGIKGADLTKRMSVYLLPKDNPSRKNKQSDDEHEWSAGEVDSAVLKKSIPLNVRINPSEEEAPAMNSLKFAAPEKRFLYVKVNAGLEGLGGFVLAKDYVTVVPVPSFPKEVKFLHDGAILALSGERKLSVLARSVDALEYRIGRIDPKEINHLVSQSYGNFQSPVFINFRFGEDNIAEIFTSRREVTAEPGKASYQTLDLSRYLTDKRTGEHRGLFIVRVNDVPSVVSKSTEDSGEEEGWSSRNASRWEDREEPSGTVSDRRLILVTDLGIFAKQNADSSQEIFVQSIRTGRPVGGAKVEVLGKNGVPVVTAETDDSGRASVPVLKDFKREQTPVAIVVRTGEDFSFMPYGRADRRLNFSRFDISGLELPRPDVLDAFVFSDRGLYRPGDTMHFGISVRQMDWKGKLEGLPLEIVVINPMRQEIGSERVRVPESGFFDWQRTTRDVDPTGVYSIGVYVVRRDNERGDLIGSTTVRVEEFLPDRLKLGTAFSEERAEGWVRPETLTLSVTLQNLYGTAAAGNRIAAKMSLTPAALHFDRYVDYLFFDPLLKENTKREAYDEDLPETKTDEAGRATVSLNLGRFDQSAYRLTVLTRGFEKEGGRSVAAGREVLVSARPWLLGYKTDGDLNYISRGSKRMVQWLAVDPTLRPQAVDGLKMVIAERYYVSVLTKKTDGNYVYQSVLKEREVATQSLTFSSTGFQWNVPTAEPGDYVARVFDKEGLRVGVVRFAVVGAGNLTRQLERNAELQAKLEKKEFKSGEEIVIALTAPYTGSGLITIERDRVYAHAWFTAKTLSSVQKIKIPADFEGNGYINVAFVRALDSREIFMSPLSYAVIPFNVNRSKRQAKVTLQVPQTIRPGQELAIGYSSDRAGKIVVYAVDEGILQVAGYELPNPLEHFLQKRALQVTTDQILDLILPEYSISREVAAAGGDGREDLLAANLNPFKRKGEPPVVYWSGVIDCDAKLRTVLYKVPDYFNGTLRVMAVAASSVTTGAEEAKVVARGPFVIQPSLPTFVAPGDTFDLGVTVANNVTGSGSQAQVTLDLEVSNSIEVLHRPAQPLSIAEGRDAVVHFTCRAKDKLGNADFILTARGAGESVRYTANLSVRPPVPYRTEMIAGRFMGASQTVSLSRSLYTEYYKGEAMVSSLPLGLGRGLQMYLSEYPNLCSEQLTSQALPMIVMAGEKEWPVNKAQALEAFQRICGILRSRQNDQGGFGLWSADRVEPFHYVSVYVMQMLTEAKERNYPVPPEMFSSGLDYLKRMAQDEPRTLWQARHQALALFILTRNGVVVTNYLDHLRETLEHDYARSWQGDLAAVYCAGAYAQMQNRDEAQRLLAAFTKERKPERIDFDFYSELGRDAQYLSVLARYFPEKVRKVNPDDVQRIVEPIIKGEYCTHSAAYAILALKVYSEAGGDSYFGIEMQKNGAGAFTPLPVTGVTCASAAIDRAATSVRLTHASENRTLAFYQVMQSGFDRVSATKPILQGLEVQREYCNAKGEVVTRAALGEELTVRIKIRSLDREVIGNVAILDLLPGGFEVVTESVRDAENGVARKPEDLKWESVPIDHAEVREDRVVVYGTAFRSVREFVYRVKATAPGQFTVSPVQAESMYQRTIVARGVSGEFAVEEQK